MLMLSEFALCTEFMKTNLPVRFRSPQLTGIVVLGSAGLPIVGPLGAETVRRRR